MAEYLLWPSDLARQFELKPKTSCAFFVVFASVSTVQRTRDNFPARHAPPSLCRAATRGAIPSQLCGRADRLPAPAQPASACCASPGHPSGSRACPQRRRQGQARERKAPQKEKEQVDAIQGAHRPSGGALSSGRKCDARTFRAQVRSGPTFHPDEAVRIARAAARATFDETIEVQVQLGIDPRKATQNVRGVAQLPFGTGKDVRIAVFARGEKAEEARAAGATFVGAEDLVEAIAKGELGFTKTIATPDVMPLVGKVARVGGAPHCCPRPPWCAGSDEHAPACPPAPAAAQILGPRGLMPNPKLGSVTLAVREAVAAAKRGQAEFRAEKRGVVMAGVGKASFAVGDLRENIRAFMLALGDQKPEGLKGAYFRSAFIKSTMGPGIPVDVSIVDPASPRFFCAEDDPELLAAQQARAGRSGGAAGRAAS